MRRTATLAGVFLFLVAALPATSADTEDKRLPIPDPAARTPAVAELKKELGEKLRAKDPEAKRTLAKSLIERAAAAKDDAVKRYVLLEQAASLAEEARDVTLALDVVGQLAGAYQVERATRGFAAVDAITRGAKETSVLSEAAGACVELTGDALAADDANTAAKAIGAAKTLAKSVKLGGLVARATEIAEFVGAFRRASLAAEGARTTLTKTPDDVAAHETLGRFLCFGRARWDEGFAELAKSGTGPLAALAAKDAAKPQDVASRQSIADGWWDLAQKEKDPLSRARMLSRAAAVYETAPSDTPADRAALVKGRLDSITYWAFDRGVALTKDFSKDGPTSLALVVIREFIEKQHIDRKSDNWRTKIPRFPEVTFGRGEEYIWRLDTNQGVITLRFFADTAPKHVANFLYLTELGFYDGAAFHRVIPGFMAQAGYMTSTGDGGPTGYGFATEFIGARKHDRAGILSMANSGQPNSDATQFFITFAAADHLDGKHTICGEVVDGMDVVKKLEAQGTPEPGKPKIPLTINTARVSVK